MAFASADSTCREIESTNIQVFCDFLETDDTALSRMWMMATMKLSLELRLSNAGDNGRCNTGQKIWNTFGAILACGKSGLQSKRSPFDSTRRAYIVHLSATMPTSSRSPITLFIGVYFLIHHLFPNIATVRTIPHMR